MPKAGFTFNMGGAEERVLTIKPGEFLKGVSKAAIKLAGGGYSDALSELPDIASSLGLKASPQKRVGALIVRGLERALIALVAEIAKEQDEIAPDVHAASFIGLSKSLKFEVDKLFFERPDGSALVHALRPDIEKWLSAVGLPMSDISNVLTRLPTVFVRALHEEWMSNAEYYGGILTHTDSPFTGAAIMEQEWARYRAYLVAMGEERVFDETFGLRQIYVAPRCYFYAKSSGPDHSQTFVISRQRGDEPVKVLRWAHPEVENWLQKQDRDFAIRTIAGGPGSGKSSFSKILAADLAAQNRRVLFVPLHQVDLEQGIVRALGDYFKQAGHFSEDPLSTDSNDPIVLILDGLDEIQMQGRAAQEAALTFVSDLIRFVDRRNTSACKILCLITGRDLAVQSAEGAMKLESQVIHLAPYSLIKEEKPYFVDKENIFEIDQRDEWWNRYGRLTGLSYDSMPDSMRAGELNEVTAQPLLNYLVALSHRRGLKLDESTNVNTVYEDLLKAVYARAWARHSHPSVKDVPYEAFVRLLEEVALSVWHGAGRTTTLAEVEAHCSQSKVGGLLSSFQAGISSGVSSLLLAFYFRQKGRRDDGSKTFEFTHKTFAEYLISLRVVRLLELVTSQMSAHDDDPDQGIDEQDALHRWLTVCGKTALDSYLLDFIRREVSFRVPDKAGALQKALCKMLEYALRVGWPVQRIEKLSFSEQQSYVRNAEETLVCCINACALVSREISFVKWPSETSAGELISRLQGQRKGPGNRPVMGCLSYMNYDGQHLDIADLYKAEMHHSSFMGAQLNYTMMMQSNLFRSNFVRAEMQGVNLSSANLKEARLPLGQVLRVWPGRHRGVVLDEDDDHLSRPSNKHNPRRIISTLLRRGLIVVDENGIEMDEGTLTKEIEETLAGAKAAQGSTRDKAARRSE